MPILNNSWGGDEFSQALLGAIQQTNEDGELFVAAAGNEFTNTDLTPNYPSTYDAANVLAVGATDQFDRKAWFSNYGSRTVDLGAPGTNVYSTWPGASYRFADGTSMATPGVSGAAALAKAVFPDATGVGLKALLLRTVDPVTVLAGRPGPGAPQRRPRRAVRGSPQAWIEVAGVRRGGGCRRGAGGSRARGGLRLSVRGLRQRDDEREPPGATPRGHVSTAPRTRRRPARSTSSSRQHRRLDRHAERLGSGESELRDRPRRATGHGDDSIAGRERVGLLRSGRPAIALRMSGVTIGTSPCCSTKVSITKPDGTSFVPQTLVGRNGGFIDTRAADERRTGSSSTRRTRTRAR